jgi:hypothetical protein
VVSWPRAVNASLLAHPIPSPPPEHVPPATQTARLVPGLRSINVQVVHPTDLYFPTVAAFRRAPRRNSSTLRAEAASRAIAPVRVVPVQDQVTALHAQVQAQSSAEDLACQPTATEMIRRARASSPASECVFRSLSRSRKARGHPVQSRFLPSRG